MQLGWISAPFSGMKSSSEGSLKKNNLENFDPYTVCLCKKKYKSSIS